jgi:hypothetical protein
MEWQFSSSGASVSCTVKGSRASLWTDNRRTYARMCGNAYVSHQFPVQRSGSRPELSGSAASEDPFVCCPICRPFFAPFVAVLRVASSPFVSRQSQTPSLTPISPRTARGAPWFFHCLLVHRASLSAIPFFLAIPDSFDSRALHSSRLTKRAPAQRRSSELHRHLSHHRNLGLFLRPTELCSAPLLLHWLSNPRSARFCALLPDRRRL